MFIDQILIHNINVATKLIYKKINFSEIPNIYRF